MCDASRHDPQFLAHALQTYRDQPERRALIGVPEELDFLNAPRPVVEPQFARRETAGGAG
ncbi:hypothetical protein GCM10020369_74240 [Cryptosporangium minutisporangium]|uniref:Uncharacterized protein n=1 Tax=Cryptosporangium minutisporangium TaxID=113569 RepID=A0ABP6TAT0_9ACTN